MTPGNNAEQAKEIHREHNATQTFILFLMMWAHSAEELSWPRMRCARITAGVFPAATAADRTVKKYWSLHVTHDSGGSWRSFASTVARLGLHVHGLKYNTDNPISITLCSYGEDLPLLQDFGSRLNIHYAMEVIEALPLYRSDVLEMLEKLISLSRGPAIRR